MGCMWNAERARELRKGLRLRQEDVADAVGVERKAVIRWEGGYEPRITHAALLADLYGVSLDSLVHEENGPTPDSACALHGDNDQAAAASPATESAAAAR